MSKSTLEWAACLAVGYVWGWGFSTGQLPVWAAVLVSFPLFWWMGKNAGEKGRAFRGE